MIDINDYDILRYWRPYTDTSGVCNSKGERPQKSWRRKEFTLHKYSGPCWGIEYDSPEVCNFGAEGDSLPEVFAAAKAFLTVMSDFVAGVEMSRQPLTKTDFGSFVIETEADHEPGIWPEGGAEYIITVMNGHRDETDVGISGMLNLPKENPNEVGVGILGSVLKSFTEVYP